MENGVVMLIRWETRKEWKSVVQSTIDELERQMGDLQIAMAESREYQVPKFLH